MNTRAFTLALLIAIGAMFIVHTYVEDQESRMLLKYGKPATVVVAKVDIQELELIDDSKIQMKTIPQNLIAPGHFREMKELANTIATVPILKGEQITKPRVTYPGAKTGLSRQVSVGKRALAITITEDQAVSKLIKPGDRVDVIAAIDYSGRKDIQKTKTVLQDVLVLSTGLSMTNAIPVIGIKTPKEIRKLNLNTYSKYNTVTLELTPIQVQKMVYFQTFLQARPYLSLRNNNDKKRQTIDPTDIFNLLGNDSASKAAAKAYFDAKYSKGKRGR